MKQVEIYCDERGYHVVVDGVDLTNEVGPNGVAIEWRDNYPVVTLQLRLGLPLDFRGPAEVQAKLTELVGEADAMGDTDDVTIVQSAPQQIHSDERA